ncbi:MAG: hypothetical protein ACYDH9_21080 [Limisphaerales bacterium]
MPKWCKTIIAIFLLPFCFAAGKALYLTLRASGNADTFWAAFLAGAACWVTIYLLLPKPMWLYVLGHELTHTVWAWAFGGKVKRLKVSAEGGHVLVTKSNFFVVLAPYFFPFYAVMVVLFFGMGRWIWEWAHYRVWFHLLLGMTYAFHVTLTSQILRTRQSDITSQGYLFAAVIIFLGNISVLLLGIPLLTAQASWWLGLRGWWEATCDTLGWLAGWCRDWAGAAR